MPEGRDAFDYLVELCEKGLAKRYEQVDARARGAPPVRAEDDPRDGLRRLLPDRLGLHPLREAERRLRSARAAARAAGSLAAYCLEITDVDPMQYGLLFERFLNPGRKYMPDMDIDFSVAGRDRVINYVAEKYGRDRVAQIITFGTMMARAAVRDAGRVLEIPYGTVDQDREADPGRAEGLPRRLPQAGRRAAAGLRRRPAREGDRRPREAARRPRPPGLDPRRRRRDRRPAADRLSCRCSRRAPTQEVVTQFPMGDVEALGLLKMDFLGLRNLDVIDKAVALVGDLDIDDDPARRHSRPTRCSRAATRPASSSSSRRACARRCAR